MIPTVPGKQKNKEIENKGNCNSCEDNKYQYPNQIKTEKRIYALLRYDHICKILKLAY